MTKGRRMQVFHCVCIELGGVKNKLLISRVLGLLFLTNTSKNITVNWRRVKSDNGRKGYRGYGERV